MEVFKVFEQVEDPRSSRNQRHPFETLMATSLLASLAGVDSFSGFADFAWAHIDSLKEYFEFPNGPASHDTYRNFWNAIDPEQFDKAFGDFTDLLMTLTQDFISLDGKTIRHSGKDKPLHIVNAWCHANQLTLAQEKADSKSNEITAIPKLLEVLDLKGRIILSDAMGAQRKICEQIIEQGGDYLISLKGNQGTLHKDTADYFNDEKLKESCVSSEEYDKGHGRIEARVAYSCGEIDWLQKEHQWPGLKSIGMVTATVQKGEKITTEKRFFISSLPADAKILNHAARLHWGIENKLHWRLDVIFNEDGSCIRNDNAAENVDTLRKWALNVLQKAKEKPDQSIKSLMRKNAMSFKHMINSVKKIFHS